MATSAFPNPIPPVATPSPIPDSLDSPDIPSLPGIPSSSKALQNILTLLGLGGQVGAAALQQGNLNKAFDYINGIGQKASWQNSSNLGNATGTLGQQAGGLSDILSGQNPYMSLLQNGYLGNVKSLNDLLPQLVNPGKNLAPYSGLANNQIYQDPETVAALQGQGNLIANTSGMLQKSADLLNSGGITGTQSPLNDYAQALMQGQNPYQSILGSTGNSLLGSSGLTPALQAALSQATNVVGNQGQTALTNQLAQTGLGLAGQSPLLSGAQAASIAQDQAGRSFANQSKTAREQAALRGGGAGSTVANGAGNAAQAEMGDQGISGIAQAANQARLGQQGLGLQQQQQGLSTALGAGGLQQGLELGGLGAISGLTGAQTGLLGTGGNLTNAAAGLGNTGANFYNQLLGLQQGNTQMGFNAGNQNVASQNGLLQGIINNILTGQNNAAQTGGALANLYQGNQGALLSGTNAGLNANMGALGQLGTQGSNWLNAAMNALNTYGGTGASAANLLKQSPYSSVVNNIGGALGGGGTSLGGIKLQLPNINLNTGSGGGQGFDLGSF